MSSRAEQAKRQLAEGFGLLFEASGVPRMAGRIFGWLLVCDPPCQSAADLARHLGASKGSISTMTRLLETYGIAERLSLPGRRVTYYRVGEDPWTAMLGAKLRAVTAFRELADRGLALLADEPSAVRRRLAEFRDTYAFFEREFPKLMARLKRSRRPKARRGRGRGTERAK